MKKARTKRIVRRKRRISEREIMRIKRKLKKSARKLRLGAKRTGAYVYGTLRRIVGNPRGSEIITKDHEYYDDVHYVWRRVPAFWIGTSVASHAHKIRNFDEYQRDARREAIRRGYMPKEYLSEAERRLLGNPYPTGGMTPLERLRYHVSGAIARGEATPIVGKPRRRIVRVLGYDVVEGSKKHMRLLAQKRHFDDLQRGERGLRGNGADHKRHRWQLFGYDVWGNAEDGWEVNNILPGPVITLSYKAEYDQKTFDQAMRRRGSSLRYSMIDEGRSDEDTLYFDTPSGKPIAEMRRLK